TKHTTKHTSTMVVPGQSTEENVPRFQNVMLRACGSRAMYDRNPVPAPHAAFTAIPASSNVKMLTFRNDEATRYTSIVAANAPTNARSGTAKAPRMVVKASMVPLPSTNTSAAPNAAPADVPASPGSTIGFRNSPCMRVPETPSTAPVSPARRTRGSRSCRKTLRASVSVVPASRRRNASPMKRAIWPGVNENAPIPADAQTAIASRIASTMYVPANESRDDVTARPPLALLLQPSRDLSETRRRARSEIHDLGLVDAVDALRLAGRRLGDARHLGKLIGAAEPVEADVGGDDDVGRRLRDELRSEAHHAADGIDRVDATGPANDLIAGRSALDREIVVRDLPHVHDHHARRFRA